MKPVFFLRNGWKKRERKTSLAESTSDISGHGCTTGPSEPRSPFVEYQPTPKAAPVLELPLNTLSLQDNWGLPSDSNIQTTNESFTTRYQEFPCSLERPTSSKSLGNVTNHPGSYSTGSTIILRHGPPPNAKHGPPGLSLSGLSFSASTPEVNSLKRPHRPPRITVHPPSNYRSGVPWSSPPSRPTTPRSPPKVSFAIPSDRSSSRAAPSRQQIQSKTDLESCANKDIKKASHVDDRSMGYSPTMQHHWSNSRHQDVVEERAAPLNVSRSMNGSPLTVHAVLDPSSDPKSKSSNLSAGSTPHLPYVEDTYTLRSSVYPATSSKKNVKGELDTLSQFPAPPPLMIRKNVPKPLILRPTPSIAPLPPSPAFSSCDSTPVSTPTMFNSSLLSKPVTPISILKQSAGRLAQSTPPYDAPTSPLPSPPQSPHGDKAQSNARRLRVLKSTPHLRDSPSPTHRNTFSEPDHGLDYGTRRRANRQYVKDETGLFYLLSTPNQYGTGSQSTPHQESMNTDVTVSSTELHVQWGYAF